MELSNSFFLSDELKLRASNDDFAIDKLKELVENPELFQDNSLKDLFVDTFKGWIIVMQGLLHPDNLSRKRALYLLKRLVDHFNQDDKVWSKFFLVIETVDEKQVHLVKQVFGHIASLWSIKEMLPWNLIILRRLFQHQNQAIAKTSLTHFLLQFHQDTMTSPIFQEFVVDSILPALNNPKYFDTNEVFEAFKAFLHQFGHCGFLWSSMIHSMTTISWAPIPLFHCLRATLEVSEELTAKPTELSLDFVHIGHFLSWSFTCQEPLMRGAAQECLIRTVINLSNAEDHFKSVQSLNDFFCTMHGPKKILHRKTKLYDSICSWINWNTLSDQDMEPLLFVMKCDAAKMTPEEILEQGYFKNLVDNICDNAYRLYGPGPDEDLLKLYALIFLLTPPKHRSGRSHLEHRESSAGEIKIKHNKQSEVAEIIISSLNSAPIDNLEKKLFVLSNFCGFQAIQHTYDGLLTRLASPDLTFNQLMFISHFIEDCRLTLDKSSMIIKDLMNGTAPKGLSGSHNSMFVSRIWRVMDKLLLNGQFNADDILDMALEHIQSGGLEAVASILDALGKILEKLDKRRVEAELIPLAKSSVFEIRKNDQFWPSFAAFVTVQFHASINEDLLVEAAKEVFAQAEYVQGLALVMVNFVADQFSLYSEYFQAAFISEAIVFGPTHKKDQTIVSLANEFIYEQDFAVNSIEGSDHMVNSKVRAMAVQLLLEHPPKDLRTLVKAILAVESRVVNGKTRFFENSSIHVVKQRISQALLLIAKIEFNQDILETALENIEAPSQQLSIRYMYEWILIIMAKHSKDQVLPRIKAKLEEAKKSRLGIVPAYLNILAHQADKPDEVDDAMDLIAPWCLGQHFMTRLCANACFRKLYIKSRKETQDKYLIINECISQSFEQGDVDKNEDKAMSDIFLTDFDPDINMNIIDIYYHFPRLMSLNDVIKDSTWKLKLGSCHFPLSNDQSKLNQHRSKYCRCIKCFKISSDPLQMTSTTDFDQVQKKIVPWSQMFDLERESRRASAYPDLIIVASLIDRSPNLGGLCRTCEIFGAGKLVLSSKRVLEDKEFLNTSVTAHQWVDVEEVKVEDLKEYLISMKVKGYTIVGIEQTSESRKLQEFQFPAKSLVFLGNEKEGIPVDLIQLLDECVEIPQTGLIRSLNVHVTGAIVIWEYVRQQITA